MIPTVARVSRGRLCVYLRARDLGIFGWLGREAVFFSDVIEPWLVMGLGHFAGWGRG